MCCGATYKKPAKRSPEVGVRKPVTTLGERNPSQEPADPPAVNSPAKPIIPRKKGFRIT